MPGSNVILYIYLIYRNKNQDSIISTGRRGYIF
jgi:hypothetical protein